MIARRQHSAANNKTINGRPAIIFNIITGSCIYIYIYRRRYWKRNNNKNLNKTIVFIDCLLRRERSVGRLPLYKNIPLCWVRSVLTPIKCGCSEGGLQHPNIVANTVRIYHPIMSSRHDRFSFVFFFPHTH